MTVDATVTCPNCHTIIKLTESLAAPLIAATRRDYEQRIADTHAALANREADIVAQQEALVVARSGIEASIAEGLHAATAQIAQEEARKARIAFASDLDARSDEIRELKELVSERDLKLTEAKAGQAELLRKQRALDDEKRELELSIEKRVQSALGGVRETAKKEAEEQLRLKVSEKEEQIHSMQRQIEELRRRAEQGSQQLQGEVLELQIESLLATQFPMDQLEPVAKGEFGGDLLQRVFSPTGKLCGTILWETKRTKNWSDGWLIKLRGDQRTAKAEISVLISEALPKGVDSFEMIDGVWVSHARFAVPLASALRQSLIELSLARISRDGQQSKAELVYEYLIGSQFRHRIEAIVERFSEMQSDLNRERKATMRLWAKREAQIQAVIASTVGMYGDLQGIAGQAMQEIPSLEMPLLDSPDE